VRGAGITGLCLLFLWSCGGHPGEPPDPDPAPGASSGDGVDESGVPPWFLEEAEARGLDFRHDSGHEERFLYPEIIGGGGALLDVEGDGDLDVYLVQSGSITRPASSRGNQLFANDGQGSFEDVTKESGSGDRGYGMGAAVGDVDGDGDVDLYVTNLEENVLLRNEGAGRFADTTAASGTGEKLWSSSAAFFDPDRDGDLDLFCVNYLFWSVGSERVCYVQPLGETYCGPRAYESPSPDTLYANRGDGIFENVSAKAGLLKGFGNGLGVACADFDVDGHPDVFVANDGNLDQLWIQTGPLVFEDQAVAFGCGADMDGRIKAGMGVGVADLDDDGDEDLIVVNLDGEPDSLFLNRRTHFIDRTAAAGVKGVTQSYTRFGVGFPDLDNDGHCDLYLANGRVALRAEAHTNDPLAEPNLLLRGTGLAGGTPVFEEVLPRGGTLPTLITTSRAACFGDLDGDGGVDVVVVNKDAPVHLLMNRAPGRANFLRLRAIDGSGADVLGATLVIELEERTLTRIVRSGYGYLAASEPVVHVGLGDLEAALSVTVRWPDGREEAFGSLAANRTWELRRGRGTVVSREQDEL